MHLYVINTDTWVAYHKSQYIYIFFLSIYINVAMSKCDHCSILTKQKIVIFVNLWFLDITLKELVNRILPICSNYSETVRFIEGMYNYTM